MPKMQVEIRNDIFTNPNFKGLNFLIQLCLYRDRYNVFIDLDDVKHLDNYKRLDIIDQETLVLEFNRVVQGGPYNADHYVSENEKAISFFSIEESIRYLIQPVSVILENSLNDSYFISKIIHSFYTDEKIINHLKNGWLQFEHAGGCGGVKNFIEGRLQAFNGFLKPNEHFLRCYVILDSDIEYPTSPFKQDYTTLQEYLDKNNIQLKILAKRAMENYLPDEVFAAKSNPVLKPWIDAYLSLSPIQKDYINIHKGFNVEKREDLPKDVSDLYSDVSNANFQILCSGMGLPNFKSEFPKLMNHHHAYKKTLLDRTSHQNEPDELEKIINAIFELL